MISKALLLFFTAFLVTVISLPNIIKIATKRQLFDERTEERKIHTRNISNLGGIGIFTGFFFCILLFQVVCDSRELGSLAAAAVLLFFVAMKDDLVPTSPHLRLFFQFVISAIIIFFGQVHFEHIPFPTDDTLVRSIGNIAFSFVFIVGMINATNFIDGVDGLAATIGLFICLVAGYLFYLSGEMAYCFTAWALAGSLLGFLLFNFAPAKIFMGDMGSMLIGVFISIFAIKLANIGHENPGLNLNYPGALIFSLLVIPLMDMVSVVAIRLALHQSPFHADKRHLHHRLLGLGMSHPAICAVELTFNALVFVLALRLQQCGSAWWPVLSTVVLAAAVETFVHAAYAKKHPGEF